MLLGGIEAGGTKMVLGLGDEKGNILETYTLPTGTPEETVPAMTDYFASRNICALGVASFGPVDPDRNSATYGYITKTPKLAWRDYPVLPVLQKALGVPAGFDTDVNAAVLAEVELGAAKGVKSCLYLTVGTGIGGGMYCEGKLVHGMQHPEWGHIPMDVLPEDPVREGFCPYHGNCPEGLASGPAMEKRWGKPGKELPADHPAWRLEAKYLAKLCATALMTFCPEKIILGGGVMGQSVLLPMIREETKTLLNGYMTAPGFTDLESVIVSPALYPVSGLAGALLLAKEAYCE
ncbi:MAG: fructokinase [Clostridiales bacterium]|nr:fructokinase [Clostridiales bacterium]